MSEQFIKDLYKDIDKKPGLCEALGLPSNSFGEFIEYKTKIETYYYRELSELTSEEILEFEMFIKLLKIWKQKFGKM